MELRSIILISAGIICVVTYFIWLRSAMKNAKTCNCEGECTCGEEHQMIVREELEVY